MDKPVFYLSTDFQGISRGIRNYFGPSCRRTEGVEPSTSPFREGRSSVELRARQWWIGLLFTWILCGLGKGRLGDREDGTHGGLQPLKRRLIRFRHGGRLREFLHRNVIDPLRVPFLQERQPLHFFTISEGL